MEMTKPMNTEEEGLGDSSVVEWTCCSWRRLGFDFPAPTWWLRVCIHMQCTYIHAGKVLYHTQKAVFLSRRNAVGCLSVHCEYVLLSLVDKYNCFGLWQGKIEPGEKYRRRAESGRSQPANEEARHVKNKVKVKNHVAKHRLKKGFNLNVRAS